MIEDDTNVYFWPSYIQIYHISITMQPGLASNLCQSSCLSHLRVSLRPHLAKSVKVLERKIANYQRKKHYFITYTHIEKTAKFCLVSIIMFVWFFYLFSFSLET